MIQTECRPLKELFEDADFAWQLLQCEVKLQTSDDVTGQDVSKLLQLYMKGVQRMNSVMDYRQAFFKQRVFTLMSRPTVMKTINNSKNAMGKKQVPAVAKTQKTPVKQQKLLESPESKNTSSGKKIQSKVQMLQLKEKKRQLELRLAYGAQQNSPDVLHKLIDEQASKQIKITQKITKIVENHDQKLLKRIKQRKLKTQAAKSLSNHLINGNNEFQNMGSTRDIMADFKTNHQGNYPIQSCILLAEDQQTRDLKKKVKKAYKSLQKLRIVQYQTRSPLRRTISYNMALHISKQNIKLWNFQNVIS